MPFKSDKSYVIDWGSFNGFFFFFFFTEGGIHLLNKSIDAAKCTLEHIIINIIIICCYYLWAVFLKKSALMYGHLILYI